MYLQMYIYVYMFVYSYCVHNDLYPGQAKTSKKPQGIISGVGMLEGNITLPTRNREGNITLPTRNREGNIRNAINYRPVNVHRTHTTAVSRRVARMQTERFISVPEPTGKNDTRAGITMDPLQLGLGLGAMHARYSTSRSSAL